MRAVEGEAVATGGQGRDAGGQRVTPEHPLDDAARKKGPSRGLPLIHGADSATPTAGRASPSLHDHATAEHEKTGPRPAPIPVHLISNTVEDEFHQR